MTAVSCAHASCRRITHDPSGRCHDHRGARSVSAPTDIPPPPAPSAEWIPGTVHPTGGYDEIDHSSDDYTTTYLRSGLPHRLDGPARVDLYASGGTNSEEWYVHGVSHREDGPSYVGWHSSGELAEESYLRGGELSRTDGPAQVLYRTNGVRWIEDYYLEGERHRLDGPAITHFHESGAPGSTAFYVGGVEIDGDLLDEVREAVEGGAPIEWVVAFAEGQSRE